MKEKLKRYGAGLIAFVILIGAFSTSIGFSFSISPFASGALACFMLACYALVIAAIEMTNPHGAWVVDFAGFQATFFLLMTIMFVGLTIFSVNLTSLPLRLNLSSLWQVAWVIVGAIIAFLSGRGTIGFLMTHSRGSRTTKRST